MRTYGHDEALLTENWKKIPEALEKMGYDALRPAQEACLKSILAGEDTFAVLPTGGGKTLLAALPALVCDMQVIVFSPLISLMADQVYAFNKHNVPASTINSSRGDAENSMALYQWVNGDIKVLLVSPERVKDAAFMRTIASRPPGMVVLDEAHCLSQWSVTFRPDYAEIGKHIEQFHAKYLLAMTATATKQIVEDVVRVMGCEKMRLQFHYQPRHNLKLTSAHDDDQSWDYDRLHYQILQWVNEHPDWPTIIYCSTVRHVTDLAAYLSECNVEVAYYHGQIKGQAEKAIQQDAFMSGRVNVMVATNAFGMGIDKPDIRRIIHADLPMSLEAIAQETGRAGRDGKDSECIICATSDTLTAQEWLFNNACPGANPVKFAYNYFNSTMRNGESQATLKEIEEAFGDSSTNAAVIFLTSQGVIERFTPPKQGLILIHTYQGCTPTQVKILDAVKRIGVLCNNSVYRVSIEALSGLVELTAAKVQTHLRNMQKTKKIDYTPPPRSKTTVIKRSLTDDDLKLAAYHRKEGERAMWQVRGYAALPDDKKQAYLDAYFGEMLHQLRESACVVI